VKLRGISLTAAEEALVMENSATSVRDRSTALIIDLVLMGSLLVSVHTQGAWTNAWVGFYGVMIAMMIYATMKYSAHINDVQTLPVKHLTSLLSLNNTAFDWPFGDLSRLATIKNLALLLMTPYIFYQGYVLLAATVLVGLGINVVMIMTMARLTQAILKWRAPPAPVPV